MELPARPACIPIAFVRASHVFAWSSGPVLGAIRLIPWLLVALALSAAGRVRPDLVLLAGLVASSARSPEEDLNAKKP